MDTEALYPIHPLCAIFPPLVWLNDLVKDIRENGLFEPIVLYGGKILDGRNRYAACLEAKVEPRFIEFEGDDRTAMKFVISKNIERRDLSNSQRAMVAAKLANLSHGGDRRSDQSSNLSLGALTQTEAGKLLHVSRTNVQSARKVLENGVKTLKEGVAMGRIAVSLAGKMAGLPKEKQEKIFADCPMLRGFRKAAHDALATKSFSDNVYLKFKVSRAFSDEFNNCANELRVPPNRLLVVCFNVFVKQLDIDPTLAPSELFNLFWAN